jgi:hypothetical protein
VNVWRQAKASPTKAAWREVALTTLDGDDTLNVGVSRCFQHLKDDK